MGDPVKIVIFVAAFLLLLLLGRKLSAASEVHPYQPPPPPDPVQPVAAALVVEEETSSNPMRPAATGAELPFPVPLPALVMDEDGKYNRPEFLNYYFSKLDLLQGPPDPTSFIDDFFVETRSPEDQHVITYKYVVCTPPGLQRVLDSERLPSLVVDDSLAIVSRWSMPVILSTVVQDIIKNYHDPSIYAGEHALPESSENS
jgi:hypothetical protein